MKKLLSILMILSFGLNAQTVSTMIRSANTLTNAATVTASLQTQTVCENITLQAVVTKSTGTIAGTVTVSGSIDGVNYIAIPSATLALTDVATQSKTFEFTKNDFMFWRVTFTGSGTQVAIPNAYLFTSGSTNKHAVSNMLSPFNAISDTTTDTGVSYVSLGVSQWYNTIAIQSVVTKISGTVAGTVTLQGSLDGINYSTVNSNYVTASSYSPTNVATSTFRFIVTGSPYRFYRLSYTGAGTMSASHRGFVLPNKN